MGSTPEHAEHAYRPTPAEELLARAKRRSAARRRRRLFTGGTSVAIVAAVVLLGILIPGGGKSQHSSQGPSRVHVTDRIGTAYELTVAGTSPRPAARRVAKAVQDAEVGFSIHLLSNLASSANSANVLVSPSSLATALAMLELGASGSTEQGIASTLDTPGLSAADQAAGWHALAALLGTETSTGAASLKQEPQLEIANALFLQQNLPVLSGFVRALSTGFQTGLWQVDFAHDLGGATDAINQWTSEHTMGLIKKLFSSGVLSPQTALVLADAVYFHADWAQSFESSTRDQPFYAAKGPAKDVPFMHSAPVNSKDALTVPVAVTSGYDAVELPYAGKKLSALVVMPTGSSLGQFVSSLTPTGLARIVSGLSSDGGVVDLSMPSFTLRSDFQLNQTLSAMGMSDAFSSRADFTGITAKGGLQVQTVEQRAYLQITPKGTAAAAVTGINVIMSAVHPTPTIVIDHPFLFIIRDNTTGTILFESLVESPTP